MWLKCNERVLIPSASISTSYVGGQARNWNETKMRQVLVLAFACDAVIHCQANDIKLIGLPENGTADSAQPRNHPIVTRPSPCRESGWGRGTILRSNRIWTVTWLSIKLNGIWLTKRPANAYMLMIKFWSCGFNINFIALIAHEHETHTRVQTLRKGSGYWD